VSFQASPFEPPPPAEQLIADGVLKNVRRDMSINGRQNVVEQDTVGGRDRRARAVPAHRRRVEDAREADARLLPA
jgi:hypothetical protein